MIDDSIVRGTTVRPLVKLLRDAGAREVHLGVTSPPFRHPCYLGLDVAREEELIAARLRDEQAIAREIGVDSLHYLSLEGLIEAIDLPAETFCNGCFTNNYPVPVNRDQNDKFALEIAAGLSSTPAAKLPLAQANSMANQSAPRAIKIAPGWPGRSQNAPTGHKVRLRGLGANLRQAQRRRFIVGARLVSLAALTAPRLVPISTTPIALAMNDRGTARGVNAGDDNCSVESGITPA